MAFPAILAVLLLPKLILSAAGGALRSPVENIGADLQGFVFQSEFPTPEEAVPLLRDYADIAITLLMAAHAAHMIGQWHRLSNLPDTLTGAGLLPAIDISRFERWFNHPLNELFAALIATALTAAIVGSLERDGLYPSLAPEAVRGADLYAGWWAQPREHPAAFAFQLAFYWLSFYLIVRHLMMGVWAVALIQHVRQRSRTAEGQWL